MNINTPQKIVARSFLGLIAGLVVFLFFYFELGWRHFPEDFVHIIFVTVGLWAFLTVVDLVGYFFRKKKAVGRSGNLHT